MTILLLTSGLFLDLIFVIISALGNSVIDDPDKTGPTLYSSGAAILQAVISHIKSTSDISHAQEIVLHGKDGTYNKTAIT